MASDKVTSCNRDVLVTDFTADDCSTKVGFHICAKVVLRTGGKYDGMGGWQFLLMVKPYIVYIIYNVW